MAEGGDAPDLGVLVQTAEGWVVDGQASLGFAWRDDGSSEAGRRRVVVSLQPPIADRPYVQAKAAGKVRGDGGEVGAEGAQQSQPKRRKEGSSDGVTGSAGAVQQTQIESLLDGSAVRTRVAQDVPRLLSALTAAGKTLVSAASATDIAITLPTLDAAHLAGATTALEACPCEVSIAEVSASASSAQDSDTSRFALQFSQDCAHCAEQNMGILAELTASDNHGIPGLGQVELPASLLAGHAIHNTSQSPVIVAVREAAADDASNTSTSPSPMHHHHLLLMPPLSEFAVAEAHDWAQLAVADGSRQYDLIVADPPWENKSVARGAKYATVDYGDLLRLPIPKLMHANTLVALWATNRPKHLRFIQDTLLPRFGLALGGVWHWVKVTPSGEFVVPLDSTHKATYEPILFAAPVGCRRFKICFPKAKLVVSVPSAQHSRKPSLQGLLRPFLPAEPACIELFGRNLAPNTVTLGNQAVLFQAAASFAEVDGESSS
eukprot:m.174943 g.174943  ORF g.174943 m.174943 type:complete len:491 (-) comp17338_c0_seq3:1337-2809(-)